MKRYIAFLLAVVICLSIVPVSFADDSETLTDAEKTMLSWKNLKKVYTYASDYFAVTKDGKVLKTCDSFQSVSEWRKIDSLYFPSIYDIDGNGTEVIFGVTKEGKVLASSDNDISGTEIESIISEVCSWKNVTEIHSAVFGGLWAVCKNNNAVMSKCSLSYAGYDMEVLDDYFKNEMVFRRIRNGQHGGWYAVTMDGKLLTLSDEGPKTETLVPKMIDCWYVESACIPFSFYVAKTSDGSTHFVPLEYAYEYYDEKETSTMKYFFEKYDNIRNVECFFEASEIIILFENGDMRVVDPGHSAKELFNINNLRPKANWNRKNVKDAYYLSFEVKLEDGSADYFDWIDYWGTPITVKNDGGISDINYGNGIFSFKPRIENSKIVQLFNSESGNVMYGLTSKGVVTPVDISYNEDDSTICGVWSPDNDLPCRDDLESTKAEIEYPDEDDYLPKYYLGVVDCNKKNLQGYSSPVKNTKAGTLHNGEVVMAIAKQGRRLCVISVESGTAYWVGAEEVTMLNL